MRTIFTGRPRRSLKSLRRFFFFQAEDGIRDVAVTGVQTCALPISRPREPPLPRRRLALAEGAGDDGSRCRAPRREPDRARHAIARAALDRTRGRGLAPARGHDLRRSEERRVGNGWRWGWAVEYVTE